MFTWIRDSERGLHIAICMLLMCVGLLIGGCQIDVAKHMGKAPQDGKHIRFYDFGGE